MSTLAIAQTPISVVFQDEPGSVVRSKIAGYGATSGDPVYEDATTGKVKLASSETSAATSQFVGIALETKGLNQAVSVLSAGEIAGFDLSGINYGSLVYLNDGVLGTTAGTHAIAVGRVVGTGLQSAPSGSPNKVLKVFANPLTIVS